MHEIGKMIHQTIPLFPLNAHVFPGGRMRLRIFEPRYMRMVKETASDVPAFAMGMFSSTQVEDDPYVLDIATLIKIIDFDPLEAGLLGITIEGLSLAKVISIDQDPDGLRQMHYRTISAWPVFAPDIKADALCKRLLELHSQYPELAQLYPDNQQVDLRWVVNRWLEILPIASELKADLIRQQRGDKALAVLTQLIG